MVKKAPIAKAEARPQVKKVRTNKPKKRTFPKPSTASKPAFKSSFETKPPQKSFNKAPPPAKSSFTPKPKQESAFKPKVDKSSKPSRPAPKKKFVKEHNADRNHGRAPWWKASKGEGPATTRTERTPLNPLRGARTGSNWESIKNDVGGGGVIS